MNLGVIGSGYVGLVTGICFAELGFKVTCVDKDPRKITALQNGKSPIYEPGLDELLRKNIDSGNISFTSNLNEAVRDNNVFFLAVGTPTNKEDGSIDLSYLYQAAQELKEAANKDLSLIIKSTVPTGTNQKLTEFFKDALYNINVISNPEFLREGFAIEDFMQPDRIVVGIRTESDKILMQEIYQSFAKQNVSIYYTTPESAELAKYAANGFLATKIAFINEIANLCEKVGADVKSVSNIMGADHRIGNKFLQPGPGYGGSCFPKDTLALAEIAKQNDTSLTIIDAVIASNNHRANLIAEKVISIIKNLENKTIACLGLAFKANTDDVRESPAISIITILEKTGAKLKLYDPQGMNNAKGILSGNYIWCDSSLDAIKNSDAVIILTEWDEFKQLDFTHIHSLVSEPCIIDLRNIVEPSKAKNAGFAYYNIGNYGLLIS